MTFVCEINDEERTLTLEQAHVDGLIDPRQSFRPAQKLRWPPHQPEILTPFLSKVALYVAAVIFFIGIAASFYFIVAQSDEFPVSFLSQSRGPLVGAFVFGRDNVAMLVYDITIMTSSLCFLFVLPDLHARSRRYLETPLISPALAREIRWGNYGGVAGIIIGLGGMFASRFSPSLSGMRFWYPPELVSLGFAPPISTIFVGPQDLALLGFAGCAICYGMLGLAGTSFVPRRVAKGMVAAGVVTSALATIIALVSIPPEIVNFLHWGLFLGTVAWMVPFNRAYVNSSKDAVPENAEFADIDTAIQKTLWTLGITSREQLASEDSQELGAILGVPASRVDLWKGMTPPTPTINYPSRIAIRTEKAINAQT